MTNSIYILCIFDDINKEPLTTPCYSHTHSCLYAWRALYRINRQVALVW